MIANAQKDGKDGHAKKNLHARISMLDAGINGATIFRLSGQRKCVPKHVDIVELLTRMIMGIENNETVVDYYFEVKIVIFIGFSCES